MPRLLLVAIGGCLGAVARYSLSGLVHRWSSCTLAVGTLLVNILGCLAIGAAMGLVEDRGVPDPNARLLVFIGFLGSFTTFSALGYETVELLDSGQILTAALNAIGSFGLGLGAAILGRFIVRAAMAQGR